MQISSKLAVGLVAISSPLAALAESHNWTFVKASYVGSEMDGGSRVYREQCMLTPTLMRRGECCVSLAAQ